LLALAILFRPAGPTAVSITNYLDGSILSPVSPALVRASVASAQPAAQIQYFANSALIGTGASPPFGILWTNSAQEPYVLAAKAIDQQGTATWSKPINVAVGSPFQVWGLRVLPGGQVLFYYNCYEPPGLGRSPYYGVGYADDVLFTNNYVKPEIPLWAPGMFVDEIPPTSAGPSRLYRIVYANGKG
jgi:hypothetical protein